MTTDKPTPELKCCVCKKPMAPPPCDDDADGMEGYIARNLPQPAKAWCSRECYDKGTIQ